MPSFSLSSSGVGQRTTVESAAPLFSTLAPSIRLVDSQADDDDDEKVKRVVVKGVSKSNGHYTGARGGIAMSLDELTQVLGGRGRAQLAWDCYSIGVDPDLFFGDTIRLGYDAFESIYQLLPSGRRTQTMGKDAVTKLAQLYGPARRVEGGVASLSHLSSSTDGTTKLLLKMQDGMEVETVIIPWKGVRSTLCVSSQVGCRQGCTFCATGRMGKQRSLTADEILAQMFWARKICRLENLPDVTNVVFMGMGEPADNVEAVQKAVEIMTTRELFQVSATKVTISTVAPTPEAFTNFAKSPCVLAWSVHAANDDLRRKLVPTTKHSMAELRQGLIDALQQRPLNFRTTMLEVVLIKGVNDSLEDADALAEFCRVIIDQVQGCKLMVNLIPWNDIGSMQVDYQRPSKDAVVAFQQQMWKHEVHTHIRTTRGDEELAACGQLSTKRQANNNKSAQSLP